MRSSTHCRIVMAEGLVLLSVVFAASLAAADPPGGTPAKQSPAESTQSPAPTNDAVAKSTDAAPADGTAASQADASQADASQADASQADASQADASQAAASPTKQEDSEVARRRLEKREKARSGFKWLLAIILLGLGLAIFAMLYGVFLRQRSRQSLPPAPGEEFLEELRAARIKAEAEGSKASDTTVDRSTLAMTKSRLDTDGGNQPRPPETEP